MAEVALGVMAISAATTAGAGVYSAVETQKANRQNQRIQKQSLYAQQAELDRQRKKEIEQQKRENQQLMNAVSGLTNTSFSGVSSPSIDYDKYGDLG